MGKSLDFVRNRIASGVCNGMENNKYESMQQLDLLDVLKNYHNNITFDGKNVYTRFLNITTVTGSAGDIEIQVKYDPDAEFEYFTMERCRCDGTLFFFYELVAKVLSKVFTLGTYNKKKVPSDYNNNPFAYKVKYTIGNLIATIEHGNDFATKEKPWLLDRFSIMLPIAMDFERMNTNQTDKMQERCNR